MSEPRYWIERVDSPDIMEGPRWHLWESKGGFRGRVETFHSADDIEPWIEDYEESVKGWRAALSAWKAEQQEGTSGNGNEP